MTPTPTIRPATVDDLRFVDHLQAAHSNKLGFLPRMALEWYLENNCVTTIDENDTPAGYLLGRKKFRWQPQLRPITQAAVCMDAMRRHLGLSLVGKVVQEASLAGQLGVQAMCRADLEACDFWRAAGFVEIGRYSPANARRQDMICYRRILTTTPPEWMLQMPPVAGWKAKKLGPDAGQQRPRKPRRTPAL